MAELNWTKAQGSEPLPSPDPGTTAYFGDDVPPKDTLDPHLFDARDQLRTEVRFLAIGRIENYLTNALGVDLAGDWLRLWITGSSAGYQWSTDADFDLMVGINRAVFEQANSIFRGFSEHDLAEWLNSHLKDELWPQLTAVNINGATYEMTYYYNEGVGTNVLNIHPYTAYDVIADRWVLHPSLKVVAYQSRFPQEWFESATQDTNRARELGTRYNALYATLSASQPGSPGYINATAGINLVASQARALYDDIHLGRKMAFQGGGTGNLDWHNFRWQMAIKSGTVNELQPIVHTAKAAREESDESLYGERLAGADELIRRAMTHRRP